jgi:hypothetical protein
VLQYTFDNFVLIFIYFDIVMDKGHIAEYDTPSTLLKDHHSKFYALCRATGNAEFKNLRRMAAEAEARRNKKST